MATPALPKVKLQCTMPDGTVFTRVTNHPYTHAVVCTETNAQDATRHAVGVWRWTSSVKLAQSFHRSMQSKADTGYGSMGGLKFAIVPVEKSK